MKAKAITRIVIYGLITMMLLGILAGGIIMKALHQFLHRHCRRHQEQFRYR